MSPALSCSCYWQLTGGSEPSEAGSGPTLARLRGCPGPRGWPRTPEDREDWGGLWGHKLSQSKGEVNIVKWMKNEIENGDSWCGVHHKTGSSQPILQWDCTMLQHQSRNNLWQELPGISGSLTISLSQASLLSFPRILSLDCDVMHCICECRRKIFQKVDNPIMSCEFCAKY